MDVNCQCNSFKHGNVLFTLFNQLKFINIFQFMSRSLEEFTGNLTYHASLLNTHTHTHHTTPHHTTPHYTTHTKN